MNHILRIPAANSIRTVYRQHSITRQDYEKVRNSRDDYGRKNNRISGIDWYRIGTHLAQACLFLSLLRVQLGHNLRYNLYNAEEKRERESGKYCVRGVQRCKEPVPKASGYIHQNAFRRGPHRKCKPVTFNWNTPDI